MKLVALVLFQVACLTSLAHADESSEKAKEFWDWFELRGDRMAELFSYETGAKAQDDPKLQKKIEDGVGFVGDKMREVNPMFSPFFGFANGENTLTVTVHGDAEYFDDVDRFIAAAPKIKSWNFVALKQPRKMAPEMEIQTGSFKLKVGDWNYSKVKTKSGAFDFTIFVPNKVSDDQEGFDRLFVQVLTDTLGERLGNTVIGKVRTVQSPKELPEGLLPFTDIGADIQKATESG
ncbi:hypothetical protein [Roseibacillus persicicus]|uniref:Uncharacterized protein n=1 Tax=Roseibacillus persicicus TaxID=454148 RepID=A0A918TZI2_9BACT|nr:hypothetical protein [Roseibacillus persicicus]GHC68064.1 hypothetical protein GCM10007100_40170 [Roseibacillus persicicus]